MIEQSETQRVLVGEKIELPTQTVSGLLEVLQKVFQHKDRPVRIQYTRGEPLIVERIVTRIAEDTSSSLSPYEVVRNYADLQILESSYPALEGLAIASARLRGTPNCLIVRDRNVFASKFGHGIDPGKVLHVPVYEDVSCPKDLFFVCASTTGRMLLDVDEAIACRLEET